MQPILVEAELLLQQLVQERAQQQPADESTAFWLSVQREAPAAVWDYIMAIDAEVSSSPASLIDDWLAEHHPALENALEGLHSAKNSHAKSSLRRVQGEVLKYSYWRLGYAYARDRQPQTGGVWYDAPVQELAAQALLGWSRDEAHIAWLEPTRFLAQWRVVTSGDHAIDPRNLARAGLFRAELELLAATD